MLYATVRDMEMFDGNIDNRFDNLLEDEWFDDSFVKKIIKDIDGNETIARGVFNSPMLGIIGHKELSGGCKALILSYKKPEREQWIGLFGDNCVPILIELSKGLNLKIAFSYIPEGMPDEFDVTFMDNGTVTHSKEEFINEYNERMNKIAQRRGSI